MSNHVIRGGSWYNLTLFCKTTDRNFFGPLGRFNNIGFRLTKKLKL